MARVLVVDDEKLIVKGIRFSLEQDGYEVDCAYDGDEAIERAKEREYDVVLLDVMLPGHDGFEVCQTIREFSEMPIIMLTAKGDDMDKILGLEYGADDYITKPFNVKLLLARCNNLLKNKRLLLNSINSSVPVSQVSASTTDVSFVTIAGNEGLTEDNKNLLDKAIGIIKENLDNPDFDMNMLADGLNMSRSKMFVVLKGITGLTPNELTLKLKMEEALRRLKKHSEFNISEISYQLGFSNPRYFSKCFKDFYGITPQGYRKELQNK